MGSSLFHYQNYTNKPFGNKNAPRAEAMTGGSRRCSRRGHADDQEESRELMSIRAYLRQARGGELFFDRRKVLDTVLASSRFPMELVAEAISMTVARNGK
jgi:hypothetical protein